MDVTDKLLNCHKPSISARHAGEFRYQYVETIYVIGNNWHKHKYLGIKFDLKQDFIW